MLRVGNYTVYLSTVLTTWGFYRRKKTFSYHPFLITPQYQYDDPAKGHPLVVERKVY